MPENEKKDGQVPEPVPAAADAKELADENLEQVAGGMGAAVPHVDHASSLNSLATPVCLSQS
jgi:hypothetical protein